MNMQTIQPSKHDMYENRQPAFLEKMLLLRSLILQTRNEFPGALSLLTQLLTIEDQQARLEVADQGPLHTLLEQLRSIDTETQSTAPTLKEEQRISMPVGVTGTGTSNTNTNKDPMACFTDREREVVQRLLQGLPNRSIAEQLIISEGTVKKHVANICGKLGVKTRTQAIAIIFSWLQEQPQ